MDAPPDRISTRDEPPSSGGKFLSARREKLQSPGAAFASVAARIRSTHQCAVRRREQRDLGDQLLENGAAERVEVLRHQDKGAGAADDVVLIIFIEPAR